jgi:plasmid stabilization system protein ParE
MRLVWTSEALQDLDEITDYILPRNAEAAADLYRRIRDMADLPGAD